jgi:hypothetical protein
MFNLYFELEGSLPKCLWALVMFIIQIGTAKVTAERNGFQASAAILMISALL